MWVFGKTELIVFILLMQIKRCPLKKCRKVFENNLVLCAFSKKQIVFFVLSIVRYSNALK